MSYTIKAIETLYDGILYRSRIEARWAFFFDILRIKHDYETSGFYLENAENSKVEEYLPDFWLPDMNMWFEVKGKSPTDDEIRKCELLCQGTRESVWLWSGDAMRYESSNPRTFMFIPIDDETIAHMEADPEEYRGSQDRLAVYRKFGGCACCDIYDGWEYGGRLSWLAHAFKTTTHEWLSAAHRMRSARFEHGETPAVV